MRLMPTREKTGHLTEQQKKELQRLLDEVKPEDAASSDLKIPKLTLGNVTGGGKGGGGDPPPPDPPPGGAEDPEEEARKTRRVVLGGAVGLLLVTRACSWTPTVNSTLSLVEQLGVIAYILAASLCLVYFVRLLFLLPGKVDWARHAVFARHSKNALPLVLAIGIIQGLVNQWNEAMHSDFGLPKAIYQTFFPSFLFAVHAAIVTAMSPVKAVTTEWLRYSNMNLLSYPKTRYILTVIFGLAALLSVLLTVRRILQVFLEFPDEWYDVFLPWRWTWLWS